MTVHALVVAAGRGTRAGPGGPKQYREIGGRTVLRRTLEALAAAGLARPLVVIHAEDRDAFAAATAGLDLPAPAIGGATRQESVRLGLEALAGGADDLVLIHDAARPFVSPALVAGVIAALEVHDGACPALPVADTLRRAEDGLAGETVPREGLARAQTPQGFRLGPIRAAHAAARGREMTDDVAVATAAGMRVALTQGEEANVKLTTAEDLARAEERLGGAAEFRTGTGFDVHAFADGDGVILCGVRVSFSKALSGHSDADVGMHALTDAIFGARGGRIVNADVTLICEAPKIGPHAEAMRAELARILGIGVGRVSVKATTTERLGFPGRGEGVAAQAACTLALPAGDRAPAPSGAVSAA